MRLMRAWLLVVLGACAPPSRTGLEPPAAKESADPVARNGACETCHQEVALEWRASLHRAAHDDADYQRAFSLEPLPFCTRCHAPEANAARPEPARASLGVGCVTCHEGPHGASATRSCASCHEFDFPDGSGKMQLTATEHRASPQAATPCAGCHMPRTGKHRDHRFAASRDAAFVRSAATIRASRTEDGIVLRFEPARVGHAFPTGDIFRRIRIVVEAGGERREVILSRKSKLGEEHDDRLFRDGQPRDVAVALPPGPARWRVSYERVGHPTSFDEASGDVLAAIEVLSGEL